MRADWQGEARAFIAEATKDLPETATLTERRRALNRVALTFHCTTSHGKKVWSREVRRYLEQHGLPPIPRGLGSLAGSAAANARSDRERALRGKLAAPDITFPYRSAP